MTNIFKSSGVDHLSVFKCVRDLKGTKSRVYTMVKLCRKNPQWFHKKLDIEAHLMKEHDIRTVLPTWLKIVEEEQVSEGKYYSPKYFNNYERERSIKPFF